MSSYQTCSAIVLDCESLEKAIQESGKSHSEICEELEISRQTWWRMRKGIGFSLAQVRKLGRLLGVTFC